MQTQASTLISNAEFIGKLCALQTFEALPIIMSNKKEVFYNIPAGFDIETSSFYNHDLKCAITYEWTFGIGYIDDQDEFRRLKTYGRTWEQFAIFLDAVSKILDTDKSKRLVVYVHNLPYEWQFMRKHFRWTKVFYIDQRKPVYAITDSGIEFRCSLKLSGKSLAKTAQDLMKYKAKKMVGDLNYNLIRTPETPLTPTELGYCEADVEVLLCYIQEKIEQEGDISHIPLTKTGYVRRYCKAACFPEEEVSKNEDPYAELDFDTSGVSRAERVLSRRVYPCKCSPDRDYSQDGWKFRLFEFLSSRDGSV